MHIFVFTATYELRVSRKSHLRDHPSKGGKSMGFGRSGPQTDKHLPQSPFIGQFFR
jgi:hypothetical protein